MASPTHLVYSASTAALTPLLHQPAFVRICVCAESSPLLGAVKVYKVGGVTDYMATASGAKLGSNFDANMLAARANLENWRSCAAQLFTSRGRHVWNYSIV
ncbi:hypothetical protein HCU64_14285 [Methylobacterium sp. C25]|uniref:hypothetical protein n=1 Tax=Methylobacterium sp. C25 TaxID=2721622 RepID=UPI001F275F65|nr:hypothetical protein [Methylobacterium sp. C25]MCE4224927.1 hypothetical protein [Methylobacterium sp. C25]